MYLSFFFFFSTTHNQLAVAKNIIMILDFIMKISTNTTEISRKK